MDGEAQEENEREEDEPTEQDKSNPEYDDEDNEETVRNRIDNEDRTGRKRSKSPPCRPRIDVLSTPNRRLILDLYQRHAYHLSSEKVEKIKELLQELYAMTPEETTKYFMELDQENLKRRKRKYLKALLRKQFLSQKKQQDTAKAYRVFAKILRNGMIYSVTHSVPPLVPVRLRNLRDIVLEQICDLRNLTKPDRNYADKESCFLIAVADWIAICIEKVYFDVQLKKNEELQKLEKEKNITSDVKSEIKPTANESEIMRQEKELFVDEIENDQIEE